MRQDHPRYVADLGLRVMAFALIFALPVAFGGDDKPTFKPKVPSIKKPDVPLTMDETVGDLAKVQPLGDTLVEGVGLVVGLDDTGSEAVSSGWRSRLLDDMRKQSVPNAEKLLSSPKTSLVLIKGTIPSGIGKDDVFDVQIVLDPGSTTTSLAGGQLVGADLFRVAYSTKGELLPQGQKMAHVYGPIMTGSAEKPDDLITGRILGGARAKEDMPYPLIINEKRRSYTTAKHLQTIINMRFSRMRGIDQEGMVKAQSDQYLVLSIPRNYHHNQFRFFQVVENLPVMITPQLTATRLERLGRELLDPKTAGGSALRLEGMGRISIDTLKVGLGNPHPQVRFFSAEALAYLGDDSGVNVLADAAKNRPEFRAFALAALAAMDQPASTTRLRELLSHSESSVRYGAFNALRIVDKSDPFLGRVRVWNEEPEPEADSGDMMAARIAAPIAHKKTRPKDPFELYVVDCEGPPLVHVAKTRRCEIVIFGNKQKLQTPIVLSAGPILVNASDGDEKATLSRVGSPEVNGPDVKVLSGLAIADVIREAANLGATYPEILTLLQAADRQRNLPIIPGAGPVLVVDALPKSLVAYDEAQLAGKDATAKADPNLKKTSAEEEKEKAPRKRLIGKIFRRSGK